MPAPPRARRRHVLDPPPGLFTSATMLSDVLVTTTGRSFSEDIEVHGWWFDDDGKVIAFRHFVDTPKHIAAFAG